LVLAGLAIAGVATAGWWRHGGATPVYGAATASAALPRTAGALGPVGPFPSLAAMLTAWRSGAGGTEPAAWRYAQQAEAALRPVGDLVSAGEVTQAEAQVKQARDLSAKAYWSSFHSRSPEIRGIWAYPWPEEGGHDWDSAMARLAQAHFNIIFPYMASAGVAYYPSAVLPRAQEAEDCDYLRAAVTAGRAHGIEVHARILALSCLFASPAQKSALAAQGRLAVNAQGKPTDWLCPTDPRNEEQLLAVATEIATRYPVQGIQLDYFRYDDTDTCVCPRCRAEFEKAAGVRAAHWPQDVTTGPLRAQFLKWRQERLTALLRALRTQLKAVRPDLRLSVAVFPNWQTTAENVGQTPAEWAKAGLVDFLCPMDYTGDLHRFQGYVTTQTTQLAGAVPLAVGIGACADNCAFDSPQPLADQIGAARAQGAAGFVVFNYSPRLVTSFLPWVELGLTRQPAAPGWPGS
jgi:uncharacterized lipoprotein YddW (UPF0748 family)